MVPNIICAEFVLFVLRDFSICTHTYHSLFQKELVRLSKCWLLNFTGSKIMPSPIRNFYAPSFQNLYSHLSLTILKKTEEMLCLICTIRVSRFQNLCSPCTFCDNPINFGSMRCTCICSQIVQYQIINRV